MVLGKHYARYERSQNAHQRLFEKYVKGSTQSSKVRALYHATVQRNQRVDGRRVFSRAEKRALFKDAQKRVAAGRYPFK